MVNKINSFDNKFIINSNKKELAENAAKKVIEIYNNTLKHSSTFSIVLAGGSTPKELYLLLSSDKYSSQIDWSKVHLFWGDERSVPPDHIDSNYRMVNETLIDKIDIPKTNIHRIKTELGKETAINYEKEIKGFYNLKGKESPVFDLILLGLGNDAHTASLFPGISAIFEKKDFVSYVWVEKLKSYRTTLTPVVINKSRNIIFLVSGKDKSKALFMVHKEGYSPEKYPAQITRLSEGNVVWCIDKEAGSEVLL